MALFLKKLRLEAKISELVAKMKERTMYIEKFGTIVENLRSGISTVVLNDIGDLDFINSELVMLKKDLKNLHKLYNLHKKVVTKINIGNLGFVPN